MGKERIPVTKAPNALTKGSVGRALVTFTVPFLLANVLQSLYGAVDLFVWGSSATPRRWRRCPPAPR